MEFKIGNSHRSRRIQEFKFRKQCSFGNSIVDCVCVENS
ncbi:DUF559 domain-containing protein [Legionella bononiensis]|uniref:DUF559 domain-containing protein n=1 Tax=Legionella bononiensis TaxID=2793102 RepID=A0ABS1WDJ5_9GAMM|nr:DUF559 domain-containing protein [Legionella bononiensis]